MVYMTLGPRLEQKPELKLKTKPALQQICSVCRAPHDSQPELRSKAGFRSKYSDCPCCGKRVESPTDRNYQARARRWIKNHQQQPQ